MNPLTIPDRYLCRHPNPPREQSLEAKESSSLFLTPFRPPRRTQHVRSTMYSIRGPGNSPIPLFGPASGGCPRRRDQAPPAERPIAPSAPRFLPHAPLGRMPMRRPQLFPRNFHRNSKAHMYTFSSFILFQISQWVPTAAASLPPRSEGMCALPRVELIARTDHRFPH